jgi:hypothetical protein
LPEGPPTASCDQRHQEENASRRKLIVRTRGGISCVIVDVTRPDIIDGSLNTSRDNGRRRNSAL